MISGLVRRYTKKGDQMAGFILEDQQNNIRCTVFPKAYEKLQYMLTDGRVVMVSARVKTDGSTPELTIDDIQSPLKLFLRMENSMDQQLQQQVRGLLSDYPGMIELRIFYNDLQTYTGLPGISGVQIDRNLLTSLKLILGEGNVVAQ